MDQEAASREVIVPRGAVVAGETFEPLARRLRDGFVPGDCLSPAKRAAAVTEAQCQLARLPADSARATLFKLQASLADAPVIDFPLQHLFPPGLYLRTIFIPAGGLLVGKIHRHRHGNILSMGHVRVFTEFDGVEDMQGPKQMISEPGTKRAVIALTNAVWTTIHLNPKNTQDLSELEADIIAASYEEYERGQP